MAALLAKAVLALRELAVKKWQFPLPPAAEREVAEYRRLNDPLSAFIEACCTVFPDAEVPRAKFWSELESFCHNDGLPVPTRQETYRRLREEFNVQEPKLTGTISFRGIGLKGAAA